MGKKHHFTFKKQNNWVNLAINAKIVVLLQQKLDNYAFDGTE